MGDRLDPADPEGVRHDRAGRTAPALGRDPLLLGEAHEVPADEEELGEAGSLDDAELMREPLDDRRRQRVVAAAGAGPAQVREVRERALPIGHREAREAVLLELEVDRAGRRDRHGPLDALVPRPGHVALHRRAEGRQLIARLEVRLPVGSAQVGQRVERPAVLDRGQDVVQLAVLASGVVDGVGHDHRQPQVAGQGDRLGDQPVVVGAEMVGQLDDQPVRPEDPGQPLCRGARAGPVTDQQASPDLPVAAARQGDDPIVVRLQQRVADPGHGLRPGQVRPRQQAGQAAPADLVAGEEDEPGPSRPDPDAAQVLLDLVAMARAAGHGPVVVEPAGRHRSRGAATRRRHSRCRPRP